MARKIDEDRVGFFDLARELRDQIYHYSLLSESGSVVFEFRVKRGFKGKSYVKDTANGVLLARDTTAALHDDGVARAFDLEGKDISASARLLDTCQ